MADKCSPIGFFDSGLGGISVLKTAYALLENENYIYYGDIKNAPYGEKSEEQIKTLTMDAGKVLFDKGVKAIVIACNTATGAAVKLMREEFNIPVISMEPAVKPALGAEGKVLVLATTATVSSNRYKSLLERLEAKDKVISAGCSGLVELIESGNTDDKTIADYLTAKLGSIKDERINAVVLGCTHYSFIQNQIMKYMHSRHGENCVVFDGRFGTVRQLKRVLESENLLCGSNRKGSIEFFTSGNTNIIKEYQYLFETFKIS